MNPEEGTYDGANRDTQRITDRHTGGQTLDALPQETGAQFRTALATMEQLYPAHMLNNAAIAAIAHIVGFNSPAIQHSEMDPYLQAEIQRFLGGRLAPEDMLTAISVVVERAVQSLLAPHQISDADEEWVHSGPWDKCTGIITLLNNVAALKGGAIERLEENARKIREEVTLKEANSLKTAEKPRNFYLLAPEQPPKFQALEVILEMSRKGVLTLSALCDAFAV